MAAYPTDFEFDVLLKDGTPIHLRPIRPDDAEREAGLFTRVGRASTYQRFFRVKDGLTPDELRYFTSVDYEDRMALIALAGDDMIAVGRYDVLPAHATQGEGRAAEVAFLIQDSYQGQGIGRHLLQHLTVHARMNGISEFHAYVLHDNHTMLGLFRSSGYKMTRQLEEGVYTVEFPLEYSIETREAEWEHEKRATTASIMPLLYPSSVAVIGASRDPAAIGGRLLKNLLMQGFTGPVYPVNPTAAFVHAVPSYPSVLDIPGPVDLAFVVVPAEAVPDVVEQCGEKGVRAVVVISAGFGEGGTDGSEAQRKLVTLSRRYGMRLVGPNCMGVLNTDPKVNLDGQFGPTYPPAGNVAMASQSGALGLAILEEARDLSIGLSSFVSLGNGADVRSNDLLIYWEEDPSTDVILLYVESFGNPRRFGRLARRIGKTKPIVIVKSGRSAVGSRAAGSHTGSMASLDVAVDALCRQSGVVRTETLDELFGVTALLSKQPLPAGRRTAVLSNAGGPAILAADALEAHGLELPELSPEIQTALGAHLLPTASTVNPVDMVASAGPAEFAACLDILLSSDEVDSVIVIHIPTAPGGSGEVRHAVGQAMRGHTDTAKTVLAVYMGGARSNSEEAAEPSSLPVYRYPETAAQALANAVQYAEWRARPEGTFDRPDADRVVAEQTIRRGLERTRGEGGWLTDEEADALLGAYGIRRAGLRVVTSADAAVEAAAAFGSPVALKVIAPSALHKSDIGGIELNVSGAEAVAAAYHRVSTTATDVEGVIVQEYVPDGHEVIVGMTEDPLFGPLVVFGLGGIFVELMGDLAFRINPLSDIEARRMIREVKAFQLLSGYRGEAAGDVEAVEDLLLRVSALIDDVPEIVEMDLNPVKVLEPGSGVKVVDARIRIRPIEGGFLPSRKDVPGRML